MSYFILSDDSYGRCIHFDCIKKSKCDGVCMCCCSNCKNFEECSQKKILVMKDSMESD